MSECLFRSAPRVLPASARSPSPHPRIPIHERIRRRKHLDKGKRFRPPTHLVRRIHPPHLEEVVRVVAKIFTRSGESPHRVETKPRRRQGLSKGFVTPSGRDSNDAKPIILRFTKRATRRRNERSSMLFLPRDVATIQGSPCPRASFPCLEAAG